MKILVTGSRGQLGSAIKDVFKGHELILTDSTTLDIRNIKQVMSYIAKKPDLIIHAAAETDHVAAEFDPVACYMTNLTGTMNMVELARILDISIVYISTCGIFDGKKGIYMEEDIPTPLNHYGRSKYYGECAVREYPKHFILRCGWGMGGGPGVDKKFINKIFQLINSGAKEIAGISDVYGSPTYQPDFAQTMKKLIESNVEYGTYNIGGAKASRYDVAKSFIDYLGVDVNVYPLTYAEYHLLYPIQVNYTKCEVLDTTKLSATGLSAMRDWRVALGEYAEIWKNKLNNP